MSLIRIHLGAFALCGLALTGAAHATSSKPFAATPQELEMCRAMIPRGPAGATAEWGHNHHYCDCIRFRFRALSKMGDRNEFNSNLGEAVAGCEYVLSATTRSFPLRPRVHIENGRAYALKGETERASQQFLHAIELRPTEVDAFVELANLQRKKGHGALALETVTLGLRHNPNAKSLQKRYLELGGKLPFPEPIGRATPEPGPKGAEPPGEPDVVDKQPPSAAQEPTEARVRSEPEAAADGNTVQDGGCRFCPPEEIQRRWKDSFGGTK